MMFAFSDKDWPGIAKMVEECGELQEVLPLVILAKSLGSMTQTQGKLLMIQGGTDHWSGDLRKAMVEEMADVLAAIAFVGEHNLSKRERKASLRVCRRSFNASRSGIRAHRCNSGSHEINPRRKRVSATHDCASSRHQTRLRHPKSTFWMP
jgi:hypothetical protein